MNTRFSPPEIDRTAAEWAARRCSGLTSQDQSALDRWLKADPRHVGAYAKAEAVLAQLDRVGAAAPDALRMAVSSPPNGSVLRRRTMLAGSVAAGLAVTAGGAVWLTRLLGQESYSTRVGETREIVLSDGSMVTLNTDSRILVHYGKARREIQLLQGEALFDVAKNKKRPFVVMAGDTQVRAVGTSFTVRRLETAPVQVLVQEGVVEVSKPATGAAPVRVAANSMAEAPEAAPIAAKPVPVAQVHRQMAWQKGQIAFEGETLMQAAAEFARYSDTRIVIQDAGLAKEEIAGLFKATDPVGFAQTIAISLNAHAQVGEGEVRLTR